MKTKIPVNEWIEAGENILSVTKGDGEVMDTAEMKVEILTAEGFPKGDEAYDSIAGIGNYSLPLNLAPFIAGPMWYDSKLEEASNFEISNSETLSKLKDLTIEVHSAFMDKDIEKIVNLFKTRFGQYDAAYALPPGNREAEFRKVVNGYYSTALVIKMKEEALAPRPHFFGKLVDMLSLIHI